MSENPEFWWIHSKHDKPWAGLRMAAFNRTMSGDEVFVIFAEADPRRVGLRVWSEVSVREGWIKVQRIPVPGDPATDPVPVLDDLTHTGHNLAGAICSVFQSVKNVRDGITTLDEAVVDVEAVANMAIEDWFGVEGRGRAVAKALKP